jgi:PHP domain
MPDAARDGMLARALRCFEGYELGGVRDWTAGRRTRAALLVLAAAYLISGVRYAEYAPVKSDAFLWVVYHVHSEMSDGLSSVDEIARQARAANVSMVILTDHGRPNLQSTNFRKAIDGVTIVGGSEATLPDGHFTFFGASETPQFRVSSFPPEAMDDAREWGAFPVLAYPADYQYGWRYWKTDLHPGGIEILNLFTSLRETGVRERLLLAMYYPFSHYYFLRDITFPQPSMAHWDDFLDRSPEPSKVWAFAASDAHGGFHAGKWFSLRAPSYRDTFSLAGMGVDRRYGDDPMRAIRAGDFFVCVRGAGEPRDFEFLAASADGRVARSGGFAASGARVSVVVDAGGQAVRVVLIKNGAAVKETTDSSLELDDASAGVYRVEVFLTHHLLLRANVPWIVSNPIFVGVMPQETPRPVTSTAIRTTGAAAPSF